MPRPRRGAARYSYRPVSIRAKAKQKAGSRTVTERDTIAGDGCWCGQRCGHDWPGKAEGAPHPR